MSDDTRGVAERITRLFAAQRFGVLATSGDPWPYATLVGLAVSDDLRSIVFVTNRATRKYDNIGRDPHVSILVDDRRNRATDFIEASALTALGAAAETTGGEREEAAALYLARHPHMSGFVAGEGAALVRVAVSRYILVSRFQEVVEWTP